MAQGHYMTHIVFFLAMLLVNTDKHYELMKDTGHDDHLIFAHEPADPAAHDESLSLYMHLLRDEDAMIHDEDKHWFQEDDLMFMSGHGGGEVHHELTPVEKAKLEMQVFTYLKWGHLATFFFTLSMLFMKSAKYYNLAQTIHCLVVIPVSILADLLAIYVVKNNQQSWVGHATEVRVWILIDVFFFFAWIASCVIFVTAAYIFKFQSTVKNEEVLLQDDNPWNDKDTEDFLRHLKMESLLFSYFIAAIIMDYTIGFFEGKDFGTGSKEWYPSQSIMCIDMGMKFVDLIVLGTLAAYNVDMNNSKLRLFMLAVFDLGLGGWIYWIYYSTNRMEGQNKFCKLWA